MPKHVPYHWSDEKKLLAGINILEDKDLCWEWLKGKNSEGYGYISLRKKQYRVHRLAYEFFIGSFNKELLVLHSCDNPPCCNPKHLFLGTDKDNSQDKIQKNRTGYLCGEDSPLSKLTWNKVRKIRKLLGEGILTQKEIGDIFGVYHTMISRIKTNKIWKITHE